MAEEKLLEVLKKNGYGDDKIVRDVGGAVFYGPKIDIKVKDSLNRKWQLSTIQFDFNLPSRFEMTYVGEDGKAKTPFMIHRALLGSLERFIGILIEHYGGAFPLWLAPVQVKLIPVSDKFVDGTQELADKLKAKKLRVGVDTADESLGKKIRNAEKEKVPYMLIIGEKELKSGNVSVRSHQDGDLGTMKLDELTKKLQKEIQDKK